jgi:hypothetical protein
MSANLVIAFLSLAAALIAIAAWIREIARERPRIQLVALTIALCIFAALTVYFWQRDMRHAEGREEASRIVMTLPCPEWGQRESEEVIGTAIAFFGRYTEEFPQLAQELAALRMEIAVDHEPLSATESLAHGDQLERAAGRAMGMLKSAAGGQIQELCPYE